MNYAINSYRSRKVGGKYFLTTDHGSYCVLTNSEFKKFKQNNIDEELKKKLEDSQIILTEKNITESARLIKKRNEFLFYGTSLHIVVVTLRCNMNCVYCQTSSRPKEIEGHDMDIETAKKTVDFIFQTPSPQIAIEFQGGEPLLNWKIVKEIIEYAEEKNKEYGKEIIIAIVTNLTEMDEEKMAYLIEHKVAICTSLDGPKELHDYNRKFVGGSNYDQVVHWIKKIKEEQKKRGISDRDVNALVTLTKKSLSQPKEIVNEYLNLGIKKIHLRYLNNLGVAKNAWPVLNYSIEEYLDFWKNAASYIEELQKQGKDIKERMVSIMINKIKNETDPNFLDLRSPCGASIGQLTYNYNGNIYTCDEARMLGQEDIFLLGNVKNDSYKSIVTGKKACAVLNASINDQYVCNDCAYKPYCGVCPVCNFSEQGSIIGKISETPRCKKFMNQFDWVVGKKIIE